MTHAVWKLAIWFAHAAAMIDAIVTRGDPNDPKFLADIQEAPFFVSLYEKGDCAGTIVGDHHVLTAAHCVSEADTAPETILLDGSTVKPWAAFMNPDCIYSVDEDGPNGCDVAVLVYEENLVEKARSAAGVGDAAPLFLPIYPYSDEVGQTMTLYGYGLSGNAADLTSFRGCNKAEEDGQFRKAQNVVTDTSDGVIRYQMDLEKGMDLEGMAQDGDSGGAATITVNGTIYLVGANSGTMEWNSCDYGSIDEYARLSEHFGFIHTILDYPDNQSICPWKEWETPAASYNETCVAASSAAGSSMHNRRWFHYYFYPLSVMLVGLSFL